MKVFLSDSKLLFFLWSDAYENARFLCEQYYLTAPELQVVSKNSSGKTANFLLNIWLRSLVDYDQIGQLSLSYFHEKLLNKVDCQNSKKKENVFFVTVMQKEAIFIIHFSGKTCLFIDLKNFTGKIRYYITLKFIPFKTKILHFKQKFYITDLTKYLKK